jgi:hypothetical protein
MSRSALAVFFERLVVATLPLAVPACGGPARPAADMSVAPPADDLAVSMANGGADLAPTDLAMADLRFDPNDPCDTSSTDPPPIYVPFPAADLPDGGFATPCQSGAVCTAHCPYRYTTCCGPTPDSTGALELTCVLVCPGPGRRPAGLAAPAPAPGCATGQFFAEAARLEAASVHAFRVLGRELAAHGAPARLVAAARRAQGDEIRHARLTRALARAHHARPAPVRVAATAPRSLEDIAVENAVEGCVRETFAALLATWQARAAADPEVRRVMAAIAPDEIRHAELAWAVDAWAGRRLDAAARERVAAARRQAVAELNAEMARPVAAELVRRVGLPEPARAAQLLSAAADRLWPAAATAA